MATQVQVTSPMQLRATGQAHLASAAKDLDDLTSNANNTAKQLAAAQGTISQLQSQVAALQKSVATIQAAIAAGATISAVVGNSTQTGSSTLDFTGGILTSFTP